MKKLQSLAFDPVACEEELESLSNLLTTKDELSEQQDILPLFQNARHLSALVGLTHPRILTPNRYAHEYDLFGDFRADLVVGEVRSDEKRNSFVFVEFEDGKRNSIFRSTGRANSDWASRLEHGFSQLLDWANSLDDMEKSDRFESMFESRRIQYELLLVIGRTQFLSKEEQRRFEWRSTNVLVDSHHVRLYTYDDLFEDLSYRYEVLLGLNFND